MKNDHEGAFRQGDLDGLCGAYALLNAARLIVGPDKDHDYETAMMACNYALNKRSGEALVYVTGVSFLEMIHLLKTVIRPNFKVTYKRPFARSGDLDLDVYWTMCEDFLRRGNRAIVFGIECEDFLHWTVATAFTHQRIILWDSSGGDEIQKQDCATQGKGRDHIRIFPSQTFFMEGMGR